MPAAPEEMPCVAVDLPLEAYPFTVEYIGEGSGTLLHSQYVAEPGVMYVPGQDILGEKCVIRIIHSDGLVVISHEGKVNIDYPGNAG